MDFERSCSQHEMMQYSKEAIMKLTAWTDGDVSAREWLGIHGFSELIILPDAVIGDESALHFLIQKKYYLLAAFVNAVWEDTKAFKILMDKGCPEWAAMANLINGDSNAKAWLSAHNLSEYSKAAEKFQEKIRKKGDKAANLFRSPFH